MVGEGTEAPSMAGIGSAAWEAIARGNRRTRGRGRLGFLRGGISLGMDLVPQIYKTSGNNLGHDVKLCITK